MQSNSVTGTSTRPLSIDHSSLLVKPSKKPKNWASSNRETSFSSLPNYGAVRPPWPCSSSYEKDSPLEYLDLYLIHWPECPKLEEYELSFKSVWVSMEKCQKLGYTRFIGVSNFSCKKLKELLLVAKIPPATNQKHKQLLKLRLREGYIFFFNKAEMNPFWQQKKLREFCKEKGIHVTAYSPLGDKGTHWGTNKVTECEVLKEIVEARRKTAVTQICLRCMYEQGVIIIVKSLSKKRLKENFEIFDWMLSQEELQKIDGISTSS